MGYVTRTLQAGRIASNGGKNLKSWTEVFAQIKRSGETDKGVVEAARKTYQAEYKTEREARKHG